MAAEWRWTHSYICPWFWVLAGWWFKSFWNGSTYCLDVSITASSDCSVDAGIAFCIWGTAQHSGLHTILLKGARISFLQGNNGRPDCAGVPGTPGIPGQPGLKGEPVRPKKMVKGIYRGVNRGRRMGQAKGWLDPVSVTHQLNTHHWHECIGHINPGVLRFFSSWLLLDYLCLVPLLHTWSFHPIVQNRF